MEKTTLITRRYDKLLNKHPGKWVAIDHDKAIATSENIEELTKKTKKQERRSSRLFTNILREKIGPSPRQ